MIRKNIKQNKGITLISMILAIIVIFIILGAISFSSINSFKVRNLQNLFSDIDTLDDAISVYYIKNGDLPVYYSSYDFNGNKCEYQPFSIKNTIQSPSTYLKFKEKNRNFISYGILDATKLNNVNLNKVHNVPNNIEAGNFFQNKTNDEKNLKNSISSGMYVINLDSHKVYYTKGVVSDGKMYYTKDEVGSTIYSVTKKEESTVEQNELNRGKEDENGAPYVTVKFWANGGVGVPDIMKVYFPENKSSADQKLSSLLSESNYAPPGRTGMKFLGYSDSSSGDVKIVYYNAVSSSGYTSNNGEDIFIKKTDCGKEINVYAIWGDANYSLIYYYKLEDGGTSGGIKPTVSSDNKTLSRNSTVPEGVSNYLCIDIPSSGYTISWTWGTNTTTTKSAIYDGDSKKNTVISETSYTTTESGTIKLKGNFTNLKVEGDNNSQCEFSPSSSVRFLKVYASSDRKDKAGSVLSAEWMTDVDRKFTVPSDMNSYQKLGIKDKNNKVLYATNPDSKDACYYIKKVIVTDTTKATQVGNKIDHAIGCDGQDNTASDVYGAYDLGESVQLPDNSSKTYCFYAYFGAKNYKLTSNNSANSGKKYYHEDLEEAFEDAKSKNFNIISIMDNVNTKTVTDYIKNTTNSEKFYIEHYDPSYAKDIDLSNSGNTISLNFSSYVIRRKGSVVFANTNLSGTSSSNAGIEFVESDSNTHATNWTYGNTNIVIKGTVKIQYVSINSNTKNNNIIRMTGSGPSNSSLKLLNGTTITNTYNVNNVENKAIISMDSKVQQLFLGCDSSSSLNTSDSSKNSNIKITNSNGYCIDFRNSQNSSSGGGTVYWNYGLLSTNNYKYKAGWIGSDDNIEQYIHTADKNEAFPCITYTPGESNNKDVINVQIAKKIWTWSDTDSGNSRNYASNTLQNAHNSMNLDNKTSSMTLTRNNDFNQLENNKATITKKVTLDFNSDSTKMITLTNSGLTIEANVTIKNFYGKTDSMISVTGKDNELYVLHSIITGNTSNYTIQNLNEAKVYLGKSTSSNVATIKGKGIYSNSDLEIDYGNVSATDGFAITLAGGTSKICNQSNISGVQGIKISGSNTNLTIIANSSTNNSTQQNGPTIESTGTQSTDSAISIQSGTVNLGYKETSPSVNKYIPTIKSKHIGIDLKSSGKFNFYDGCISSSSKDSIHANGTNNPTTQTTILKLPGTNYEIKYEERYKNEWNNKIYSGETAHLEAK